jgi:hypothetical protein
LIRDAKPIATMMPVDGPFSLVFARHVHATQKKVIVGPNDGFSPLRTTSTTTEHVSSVVVVDGHWQNLVGTTSSRSPTMHQWCSILDRSAKRHGGNWIVASRYGLFAFASLL